jgi:hypothetical protein
MPRGKIREIFYKYVSRRNKTQERLKVDRKISSVPKYDYWLCWLLINKVQRKINLDIEYLYYK